MNNGGAVSTRDFGSPSLGAGHGVVIPAKAGIQRLQRVVATIPSTTFSRACHEAKRPANSHRA
ncbi:hypothetical protein AZ78_5004 [Lysobacter capsici AZ78]|uniref:Uncharacterized protein n=1 Tax=Lysobacter capsici AZ78 TaxID=1444315 RepID=A0A108U4D7_9GAMM|nr:hypothetical protein AZ78_5004 [Lysobacter capsici AZ78]